MTETDIFKAQNSFAPEFIRGVFDNHTSFEKKHILSPAKFEQHNIVSRYCPILVSNFGPLFYMLSYHRCNKLTFDTNAKELRLGY